MTKFFGTQDYKKNYLIEKSITDEKWVELEDDKKWHWFTKVKSNEKYLNEFIGLNKIFDNINSGVKTDRDSLFIDKDKNELTKRMKILFSKNLNDDFINKYNVKNSSGYKLVEKIKNENFEENNIIKMHYRPFDFQFIYYKIGITSRPAYTTVKNFLNNNKNIGLAFTRQNSGVDIFHHCLVSKFIIDGGITNSWTYIAPLYLYEENFAGEFKLDSSCKPNWTDSFKEFLKNYISDNPKEILNYIYAILYSPTYRENYKEDLKYDYPRIPFTKDKKIFDRLQKLGGELIDLHLLKKVPQSNAGYPNKGEHKISYSKYNEEEKRLYINEKQYFENVKKEVYNYSIGGYKPIEKYIKARDILTLKDISHLIKVIAVIERTIYLQEEIDKVWREADF